MKAREILEALSLRHLGDVFVPECKIGPSCFVGCPRLDAWVMKKSWTNPLTIGYEIKVSRGDFLSDNKWQSYLPYCNEFYFACPSKMIDKSEVPDVAGLLYLTSTGTRLICKKKAPYRDVQIPEEVFRYILMARVYVTNVDIVNISSCEYWKNWLREKEENRELGHRVSEAIRSKVIDVEQENRRLKGKIEEYEDVEKLLKQFGIEGDYYFEGVVRRKLEDLQKVVPGELENSLQDLKRIIDRFEKNLKKLEGEKKNDLFLS